MEGGAFTSILTTAIILWSEFLFHPYGTFSVSRKIPVMIRFLTHYPFYFYKPNLQGPGGLLWNSPPQFSKDFENDPEKNNVGMMISLKG